MASKTIINISLVRAVFIAVATICYFLSNPAAAQAPPALAPHIKFNSESFNFGVVEEGVEIKHSFVITNTGNKLLIIRDVTSTCGCTVPVMKTKRLRPGEHTTLTVMVNTSMKQDSVTKKVGVLSNDPKRPVVNIALKLTIRDPHIGMNEGQAAVIFTNEKCARCHALQGVGLFGEQLYRADCAMCHGVKANGAVGPSLRGPYKSDPEFAKRMTDIISYGSKIHKSMPGFLGDVGGPLAKEQIDSLVFYLETISDKKKAH
jgi:cytochrome c5